MVKNLKRFKRQYEREQNKVEANKWDFFPTTFVLPVSCRFWRSLNRYRFLLIDDTCPLQSEYHMFVEEFKRKSGTIWIMKPAGRAQGKGIFLFTDLKDITDWKKVVTTHKSQLFHQWSFKVQILPFKGESKANEKLNDLSKEASAPEVYVVQRYLSNPYLIGGKKFDMRIYVLVTSVTYESPISILIQPFLP